MIRLYRNLQRIGCAALIALPLGCGGGGGHRAPANSPPETRISIDYINDGTYGLRVLGTDKDGAVRHIYVKVDDGPTEIYDTGQLAQTRPVRRSNRIMAYAEDDRGAKDPTPDEDGFVVPEKGVVLARFRDILEHNRNTLLDYDMAPSPGIPVYLNDRAGFVDALLTKPDCTFAALRFTGMDDDVDADLRTRQLLKEASVPSRFFVRIPLEEIERILQDFIRSGYSDDF